jgi:hypothetical protein
MLDELEWGVGQTPWSAADALVGLLRVQGDPRGPGGPPHNFDAILSLWNTK